MGKIKVGVVGIGHLGVYHLKKYGMLEKCTIVGVVDVDVERAKKAAETFNCAAFADYRDLIGKVDAVSIAVPTNVHYVIARDFLSAGVDTLLEKPMTSTLEEADELISTAESNGAVLQIGFVERFNPAIRALDAIIERPLFIESHRLHPFFQRGTDVDVVLDLMIHDLDIILHVVKGRPTHVEAVGISVLSDKIDISNARITFDSGCVANITASRVTGKKMQKIRFFSYNGYHSVDYGKRELVSLSRKQGDKGQTEIISNNVEIKNCDPLEEEIKSFIHSVLSRDIPAVSGREGRKSLDLAIQVIDKMKVAQGVV
ncbi:MAG: Gfo/Idh/MocA family oxidoreductase [Deltaproteobacteria bacterium]|nr:Gfo/Idh/MocA family oxidoreductase [Deltaproteobacteria bacterium]